REAVDLVLLQQGERVHLGWPVADLPGEPVVDEARAGALVGGRGVLVGDPAGAFGGLDALTEVARAVAVAPRLELRRLQVAARRLARAGRRLGFLLLLLLVLPALLLAEVRRDLPVRQAPQPRRHLAREPRRPAALHGL